VVDVLGSSFSSRKFWLALTSLFLLTFTWIATGNNPVLASSFDQLITGVMGILMLYYTGNVGSKFVAGKFPRGDSNGPK
jgi:hypothetical protein